MRGEVLLVLREAKWRAREIQSRQYLQDLLLESCQNVKVFAGEEEHDLAALVVQVYFTID